MNEQSQENEPDPATAGKPEPDTPGEASTPAADSPQPDVEMKEPQAEGTPTGEDQSSAQPSAHAPAEGWYPDPNAGGANVMRYWNGDAWTEKVKEGQTEINTTQRTDVERKAILAQQLQGAAARGLRIESQSEFQAILVKGQPVNNTLHAILTVFTCLLWGIVWAVIAATGGEKREMIVVDEFGNVQYQRLGKA
jgi:hypothetical protein